MNADAEKKIAIQSQQLEFSTQQINTLTRSVADLQKELQEEKNEHNSSIVALEELKKAKEASPMKMLSSRVLLKVDELSNENLQDEAVHEKRGKRKRHSPRNGGGQSSYRLDLSEVKLGNIELENQDLKKTVDLLTRRIENNVEEFYRQKSDLETVVREIERYYKEKQQQDESRILLLESKTYSVILFN